MSHCTVFEILTLRPKSINYANKSQQESPLPLTDPRDAVTQRMLNIPYRIMS